MRFITTLYFLTLFCFTAAAQKQPLYYLLDTAKVPVNDRMIVMDSMRNVVKLYDILVPCIQKSNEKFNINFHRHLKADGDFISEEQLKKMKLTPLWHLIKLVCDEGDVFFDAKYEVYFIEPVTGGYKSYRLNVDHPNTVY